jgi:hypothetical protein
MAAENRHPRSAAVALAVVRHLPVNDLVLLTAAYEDLWIPPIFASVERWFRRLNDQLTNRIFDEFDLTVAGIPRRLVTARIIDFDTTNENVSVAVVDDEESFFELKPQAFGEDDLSVRFSTVGAVGFAFACFQVGLYDQDIL